MSCVLAVGIEDASFSAPPAWSNLQKLPQADYAAVRTQHGYLEHIGAQLATQLQRTTPAIRQPLGCVRPDLGGPENCQL